MATTDKGKMQTRIKFCIIKANDNYLCKVFDPGMHYSDYTHEDASFSATWRPLNSLFDLHVAAKLLIFESEDAARAYMQSSNWSDYKDIYEIINMEDAWSLTDKILLGEQSE